MCILGFVCGVCVMISFVMCMLLFMYGVCVMICV